MSREQLRAEAIAAGQAARHNLRHIRKNPEALVDPAKQLAMEAYLEMLIRFSVYEMKNARRLGRTSSLRTPGRNLISSIIPCFNKQGNGGIL